MSHFERIPSSALGDFLWDLLTEMEGTRKLLSHDLRSTAGKARAFFDILLENVFSNTAEIPTEARRSQELLAKTMEELDAFNKNFGKRDRKVAWVVESAAPKRELFASDKHVVFTGISPELTEFASFFPDVLLFPIAGPVLSDRNEFELKIRKIQVRYYDEEKWSRARSLDSIWSNPE